MGFEVVQALLQDQSEDGAGVETRKAAETRKAEF